MTLFLELICIATKIALPASQKTNVANRRLRARSVEGHVDSHCVPHRTPIKSPGQDEWMGKGTKHRRCRPCRTFDNNEDILNLLYLSHHPQPRFIYCSPCVRTCRMCRLRTRFIGFASAKANRQLPIGLGKVKWAVEEWSGDTWMAKQMAKPRPHGRRDGRADG